jgi:hypothetical protein
MAVLVNEQLSSNMANPANSTWRLSLDGSTETLTAVPVQQATLIDLNLSAATGAKTITFTELRDNCETPIRLTNAATKVNYTINGTAFTGVDAEVVVLFLITIDGTTTCRISK